MNKLTPFFNLPDNVLEDIQKAYVYFELTHQEGLKAYKTFEETGSGTLNTLGFVLEMEKIDKIDSSAPWASLLRILHILDKDETEIDLKEYEGATATEFIEIMKLIYEGREAIKRLNKVMEPLEGLHEPILDASQVSIDFGGNKYGLLHCLKIHDFGIKNKDEIVISDPIFQIESPDELIKYLKAQKYIGNTFFITVMRNKEMDFKSVIYMFLLYDGVLYSIDTMERRLNLNNTHGCRGPDRYIERTFDKVWLPIYLLFDDDDEKKEVSTETIPVLRGPLYEIITISALGQKEGVFVSRMMVWIEFIISRILYEIGKHEISKGYTASTILPLLPGKVDIDYGKEKDNINQYLVEGYGDGSTALAMSNDFLPQVIGTQEYINDVVQYSVKEITARSLEEKIEEAWLKDGKRVQKEIKSLISKYGHENFIIRALEDREYPVRYWENHNFASANDDKLFNEHVLELANFDEKKYIHIPYEDDKRTNFLGYKHVQRVAFNGKFDNHYDINQCFFCHSKVNRMLKVTFRDYRQMIEFFGITEKELPKEVVLHLHQCNTRYTGNSILDDIDPIDLISDPWFTDFDKKDKSSRHSEEIWEEGKKVGYKIGWGGHRSHEFTIVYWLCGRCLFKCKNKLLKNKDQTVKKVKVSNKKSLMKLYGDAFIELKLKYIDIGCPDELHNIFDWAVSHGAKASVTNQHPLNVHQRVLNALEHDERFEKNFITYPGIYKKPVRCFKLKEVKDGE